MTMRVAFIGAGKMASDLMACVDDYKGATITAVCDVDEAAAETAAEPREADVYTDHETLFEVHDFDVVFVAIPPFAYSNQATLAAEHGVHTFIEKPVALRPKNVPEVRAAFDEADIVTGSGYVFRYDRITERARELVGNRDLALVDAQYWGGLPSSEWGYRMASSGGDVNIRTTHVLDTMRYLAGEVECVSAAGSHAVDIPEVDYPAAVAATLEHETGVVGTVSSTVAGSKWTVDVEVVGEDLQLHLDYASQTLSGVVDGEEVDFDGSCDRYAREVHAFFDACAAGTQDSFRSPYTDAARTLDLNWAVIDAANSGERVELDSFATET